MLVGHEVAEVALEVLNGFRVIFGEGADILVAEVLTFGEANQLIRQVFVENEAEDVVLVFICFDRLGSHLVGGFPDFGGELLFVHGGEFLKSSGSESGVCVLSGVLNRFAEDSIGSDRA